MSCHCLYFLICFSFCPWHFHHSSAEANFSIFQPFSTPFVQCPPLTTILLYYGRLKQLKDRVLDVTVTGKMKGPRQFYAQLLCWLFKEFHILTHTVATFKMSICFFHDQLLPWSHYQSIGPHVTHIIVEIDSLCNCNLNVG